MTRHVTPAETARLIRTCLREAFPKTTFSVRTKTYAGGASARVRWVDGPTRSQVDEIIGRFAGATFDPMTDLKSPAYATMNSERVRFGTNFVFAERSVSPAFVSQHLTRLMERYQPTGEATIRTIDGVAHVSVEGQRGYLVERALVDETTEVNGPWVSPTANAIDPRWGER